MPQLQFFSFLYYCSHQYISFLLKPSHDSSVSSPVLPYWAWGGGSEVHVTHAGHSSVVGNHFVNQLHSLIPIKWPVIHL